MERLTIRNGDGTVSQPTATTVEEVFYRLAAYEDNGLTPEEVKDIAENAETRLLIWFEARYGFSVGTLMDWCEAAEQGRLVVLAEPRLPLIWGDANHDTILCPACEQDLMGGFELAQSCEDPMFQCPHCGQIIDDKKALTREEAMNTIQINNLYDEDGADMRVETAENSKKLESHSKGR